MGWQLVGEPRPYEATSIGGTRATGWAWDIEDHGIRRIINAEIVEGAQDAYAFEDAEAAVRDVLPEVDPPRRLILSSHGVVRA
jgi:hypothetical protein